MTVPILVMGAAVSMTASAAPSRDRDQIDKAVRAPYEALAHRDPAAFCDAFTPAASAKVVAGALASSTCMEAVAELFAKASPNAPVIPSAGWQVTNIVRRGAYASASVRYGHHRIASLVLRQVAGRWLIATYMRLVPIEGCAAHNAAATDCPEPAYVAISLIEWSTAGEGPALPLVPASVRRAGGKELSDFKRGRLVFAQSGCEACHRIGVVGNRGPGPDLTHLGSAMSSSAIDHVLVDPKQPMPSFKNLPRAKFHALVRFLGLLR